MTLNFWEILKVVLINFITEGDFIQIGLHPSPEGLTYTK